jgi:hypothetical protein
MGDSAKMGAMEKGMTWSLFGGNQDGLRKQPSVCPSTEQVGGVGRVTPTYSSDSGKRKLDPN